jgi:glutathione-specific gamma-glutamylcyclotransferase
VPRKHAEAELRALWQREMPIAVYQPRWLNCITERGAVTALAFTLPRSSPSHLGPIDDTRMLDILRYAQGRYGTTLDYLMRTAEGLHSKGIHDAEVRRLAALARRHGLVD